MFRLVARPAPPIGTRLLGLSGIGHGAYTARLMATVRPVKPDDKSPAVFRKLKQKWREMDADPARRKRFALAILGFYIVTGLFGFQYLKDTRYKATGEQNPYKKLTPEAEAAEVEASIAAPRDTTEVYEKLAEDYDNKIWKEELFTYIWYTRRKLVSRVRGDALEVSCGTGRNMKYLRPAKVKSLTFVDSSEAMLNVTKKKFDDKFPDFENVQYVKGRAEDLVSIASKSGQKFDTIFESFGLCSHEDPNSALQNFRQLLRPGGRIILLEHGRSKSYESINERIDRTADERAKEWGCRWNLDIDAIVQSSGLEIVDSTTFHYGTTYFYELKVPGDP